MSDSIINLFYAALDDVETQAQSRGLTMTSICRDLGVARATPDRWRKEPPKTIALLDQMQRYVSGYDPAGPRMAVPALPNEFFKKQQ